MMSSEFAWTTHYCDRDLTFFMGLHHDQAQAREALRRLRLHYPESRVLVRSDGDRSPNNQELFNAFLAEYREEEQLFPIEHGGALVKRTFELFLEEPTAYLFKLDPDTAVYRRFRFLPKDNGAFGAVQSSKQGCESIQGGLAGFTYETALQIHDSGLLDDPRLKNPELHRAESPLL